MTNLKDFLNSVESGEHEFAGTLDFVAQHYDYRPQAFTNADLHNAAGQNEGSCKVLGLAKLEGLSDEQALLAFGEHYRDVLADSGGEAHGNIRRLMVSGLAAVAFEELPLRRLQEDAI
ncbi:HopJ type III effector protein [Kribbella sp. NPDC051770]|uniref:HopJ type III effector protein n=1 Tax=Kribbella sp. NPDC051770 TaxID=3155413 RepID=UPI00342AF6C1